MPDWRTGLPYRPNVGICLINHEKKVWTGKTQTAGPETVSPGREWQMPQGGIEESEDIAEAAKRELWEETGMKSVDLLGVTEEWWHYDFPEDYQPSGHKLDPFRGQKQKWTAFRFTGNDKEVDISAEHTGEIREFFEWAWLRPEEVLSCCVEYKVQQYRKVFQAFDRFL